MSSKDEAPKASISKYGEGIDRKSLQSGAQSGQWIADYILVEMFGIGTPGTLEPPGQEATVNVHNFLLVPFMLERLIILGNVVSLDAFLYVLTFLPIRVLFSTILLLIDSGRLLNNVLYSLSPKILLSGNIFDHFSTIKFRFHRTNLYDLMRGLLLLQGYIALRQLDMSKVYHYIRGQNVIKLYVLCSMMEIMDKLLSSFGQDVFDSLYWQTKINPRSPRLFLLFLLVSVYVTFHSCLYFLQVATLTVVMNSADTALITVLILNNFSELRAFVFKKYDANHLFQLSCADTTERFQILLSLTMIFLVAINSPDAKWSQLLWWEEALFYKASLIFAGEMAADAMKHAFINKFNGIDAAVYKDYAAVLRMDILSNQKDQIILDHTYSVTRRLGLCQIPLGCMCLRYLYQAWLARAVSGGFRNLTNSAFYGFCVLIFVGLVCLKLLLGIGLHAYASAVQWREMSLSSSPLDSKDTSPRDTSSGGLKELTLTGPGSANSSSKGNSVPSGKPQLAEHFSLSDNNSEKVHHIYHKIGSSSLPALGDKDRRREHKEFMQELASIERYKVHKGRIV